jgi:hypothetical protein
MDAALVAAGVRLQLLSLVALDGAIEKLLEPIGGAGP